MAESPLDRLKRLAAEKKQVSASAQPITIESVEKAVTEVEAGVAEVKESYGIIDTKLAILSMQIAAVDKQVKAELNEPSRKLEEGTELHTVSGSGSGEAEQTQVTVATSDNTASASTNDNIGTSDHPLAMQFAELEQALLAQQPEFKTILRQIHRHLGQEPELVTQMTEQEIQMIVSGLVIFANAEIVAPAIAKTAKAAIKAAKAKPISADDL